MAEMSSEEIRLECLKEANRWSLVQGNNVGEKLRTETDEVIRRADTFYEYVRLGALPWLKREAKSDEDERPKRKYTRRKKSKSLSRSKSK